MPLFRCDEATVYGVVALTTIVLLTFTALRGAVHILGAFLSKVAHRFVHPAGEGVACVAAVVVSVVLFADGSALLPALCLLASATSCALCRSLRSFRWLWVSSFVCYSVLLLNVVGPLLLEDVDVTRFEFATLVRGQHVLVPSVSSMAAAAAAPGGARASRYLYSYYDSVKMEGSASPVASSALRPRNFSSDAAKWLQNTWAARGEPKGDANLLAAPPRHANKDALPTHHIIASGDNTLLTHYAERVDSNDNNANVPFVNSIYLVGRRSRLEHSHIRCLASAQSSSSSSSPAHAPCLYLHSTTLLRNITIYWTETPVGEGASRGTHPLVWHAFHTLADSSQTCTEVQSELAAYMKQYERGHGVGDNSGVDRSPSTVPRPLLDCIDALAVSELPSSFVAQAPFPVRFGWHFPGYLHRVQDALFVVADRVVLPFAFFLAHVLNAAGGVVARLFSQFGSWFVDVLPHVKHAAEEVAVYAGGLACGAPTRASTVGTAAQAQATVLHAYAPSVTRCRAFARAHASSTAFKAGVQTRRSVGGVWSTLADAADLFPGVWTVYRWAWDVEVKITVGIVKVVCAVGHFLIVVFPRPLMHVLSVLARFFGGAVMHLGHPLRAVWRWLARLHLLTYVSRLGGSLWSLEARALRYEWSLFQYVAAACLRKGEVAAQALLHFATLLFYRGSAFMTRYGQTSFSIHLVVTFLQSLLLLIAMRNEMRELVETERLRAPRPHSPLHFAQRMLPRSVAGWLPLQSVAARVNGFMLLVRAHHQACMNYLLLHSIGMLVLIGLSVLPFTSKLYALSLRYVLPWMSSKAFLVFFDDPPNALATLVLVGVRMALSTMLQHTIGDFLYHIVRDILIAGGLAGGLTLALWAWPQRSALAQQVATAIADSLQGTPVPTPQRGGVVAAAASPPRSPAFASRDAAPQETSADAVEGEEKRSDDARSEDDGVTKKIDLSEAT